MQCIIMRGIPGSGKTTHILDIYPNAFLNDIVCSADLFFSGPGGYQFDPKRLTEAHASCLRKFMTMVDDRCPLIFVDNTNTTPTEIAPYYQIATAKGYDTVIVTIICDLAVACRRNSHNVHVPTIMQMYSRILTESLPPWWRQEFLFATGE